MSAFGDQISAPAEPASAGDEVDEQVARVAEVLLERRPDEPEHEHVHPEVDEPVVEERGRDEPPPLALGDADDLARRVDGGRDEDALLVDPAARPLSCAARRELEHEERDVDPDERERDVRAVARRATATRVRAARFGAAVFPPTPA